MFPINIKYYHIIAYLLFLLTPFDKSRNILVLSECGLGVPICLYAYMFICKRLSAQLMVCSYVLYLLAELLIIWMILNSPFPDTFVPPYKFHLTKLASAPLYLIQIMYIPSSILKCKGSPPITRSVGPPLEDSNTGLTAMGIWGELENTLNDMINGPWLSPLLVARGSAVCIWEFISWSIIIISGGFTAGGFQFGIVFFLPE